MVQRKMPNKLGIKADHVKSHKPLVNLKPSSPLQHQESKNKGPDKKIMKRCTKQSLSSQSFRRPVPQPGKPPPSLADASPPQMVSPIKTSPETTPNYMKPTSSSDARKDKTQVSSNNLKTMFDSKMSSKKNEKGTAKTSSLKLVRTLTKTTSFKPARTASKKGHPFVQRECFDVKRATCSSTFKDSKFPSYLDLSPGGTEAEGTSIMKVCPYTYCSLNGHHHHPPLPPLKLFMSARRRMIKTQRSRKLGCLSPCRSRPNMDILKEGEELQVKFKDKFPKEPQKTPLTTPEQPENDSFFIEIYNKEGEVGDRDENLEELESPLSEFDYMEIFQGDNDTLCSEIDAAQGSPQEKQEEDAIDELFGPEATMIEGLISQDYEVESIGSIMSDIEAFSPSDSDWEMEGHTTLYLDDQVEEVDFTKHEEFHATEESIKKPDETENKMNCDGDLVKDDKGIESFGELSHDEIDELAMNVDTYQYDEIVNTNNMIIEAVEGSIVPKNMDSETFKNTGDNTTNGEEPDLAKEMITTDIMISFHGSTNAIEDFSSGYVPKNNEYASKEDGDQCTDCQGKSNGRMVENLSDNDTPCVSQLIESEISAHEGEERSPASKLTHLMDAGNTIRENDFDQYAGKSSEKGSWIYQRKGSVLQQNEPKEFNPKPPNFLPVEPEDEGEKVDLKHQMMDDRRNSEEWMIDHALQQAVTKLSAARKKKVTLLVEAFETVLPLPKYEIQLRHHRSVGLGHAQRMQACS